MGGKKSKAGMADPAKLENEIRSNLLKAGGAAFVEENKRLVPEAQKADQDHHKGGRYPVLSCSAG